MRTKQIMRVDVKTAIGPYGEPEPVSFSGEDGMRQVREILDRWPGDACSYFKVAADDDAHYILQHAYADAIWDAHQVRDV